MPQIVTNGPHFLVHFLVADMFILKIPMLGIGILVIASTLGSYFQDSLENCAISLIKVLLKTVNPKYLARFLVEGEALISDTC